MSFTREREEIIVKMVAAVVRENFSRLARKYGREMAFQVWVEYEKRRGKSSQSLEERLNPDLTLAQALDIIGEYTRLIYRSVQERLEEERKKQK